MQKKYAHRHGDCSVLRGVRLWLVHWSLELRKVRVVSSPPGILTKQVPHHDHLLVELRYFGDLDCSFLRPADPPSSIPFYRQQSSDQQLPHNAARTPLAACSTSRLPPQPQPCRPTWSIYYCSSSRTAQKSNRSLNTINKLAALLHNSPTYPPRIGRRVQIRRKMCSRYVFRRKLWQALLICLGTEPCGKLNSICLRPPPAHPCHRRYPLCPRHTQAWRRVMEQASSLVGDIRPCADALRRTRVEEARRLCGTNSTRDRISRWLDFETAQGNADHDSLVLPLRRCDQPCFDLIPPLAPLRLST
jgi:hypothetical protein